MILTKEQLHDALVERHGADIQAKLDKACVGIAGLGGLGSNLAIFLARLGVGHLILVDFDVVDITNLNRQHYTMKDLGIPKTLALVEQLEAINPYLTYETYTERVVPSNVERLFSGCDVVVEAFDKPDQKAMLLENLLTRLPEKPVVSGSGMAGYGSANLIKTEKRFGHVYLCGDGTSDVADGLGLMAPRVAVCSPLSRYNGAARTERPAARPPAKRSRGEKSPHPPGTHAPRHQPRKKSPPLRCSATFPLFKRRKMRYTGREIHPDTEDET